MNPIQRSADDNVHVEEEADIRRESRDSDTTPLHEEVPTENTETDAQRHEQERFC